LLLEHFLEFLKNVSNAERKFFEIKLTDENLNFKAKKW
jgi:hypothetical protein